MVGPSGKWIRLLSISNVSFPTRFLIWIGSDQEKTFGPTITGLIYNNIPPERMILWDSRKRGGRPDSVKLLKEVWDSFGAEVIFITSNRQGNDEMMQGCREGTWQHQEPWRAPSLFCDYDTVADTLSSGDACVWHAVGFLKPARRLAFTPSSALMFYIAYHAGYVFFDGITLHITHRMGSKHLGISRFILVFHPIQSDRQEKHGSCSGVANFASESRGTRIQGFIGSVIC